MSKKYDKELKDLNIQLPIEHPNNKHAYYIYVVAHKNRDKIISSLLKKGNLFDTKATMSAFLLSCHINILCARHVHA